MDSVRAVERQGATRSATRLTGPTLTPPASATPRWCRRGCAHAAYGSSQALA
jgi:hypothetical protein